MVHARSGQSLPLPPEQLRFMSENDEQQIGVGDELAGSLVSRRPIARPPLRANSKAVGVVRGH